jgi:hypothetical protein
MASKQSSKQSADLKFEQQDFDLFKAIEAIDLKDYEYLSKLTEEQQRKFVPYLMLHWISAVKGRDQVSAYYLMNTDASANKHMFNEAVQKHPELQWKMLCAVSPGIGKQFHQWIPHLSNKIGSLKSAASLKEVSEYFGKIYKGTDQEIINQCASEYTADQNHKYRIAQLYPDMKLEDIAILGEITTEQELKQYETELGIESS